MQCLGYHATPKELGERIDEEGYRPSPETSWLGEGVYFWETDSIFDGHSSAYWWAKNVRRYDRWVIYRAVIRSDSFFDLANNISHQGVWIQLRTILREKHRREGKSHDTFQDYFIIKFLVDKRKIDFIRAITSEYPTSGYITHIVLYPRLVINVINTDCIVENQIVREGM